jgi:DNA-binding MarR family transcriptional regulator
MTFRWNSPGKGWQVVKTLARKYDFDVHRVHPVPDAFEVMDELVEQGYVYLYKTEPSGVRLYKITEAGRKAVAAASGQKPEAAKRSLAGSVGGGS